jgi:hypothetical protein
MSTHTHEPTIITTPPEPRQIAKVLTFDATLAPYIHWDAIAQHARTRRAFRSAVCRSGCLHGDALLELSANEVARVAITKATKV